MKKEIVPSNKLVTDINKGFDKAKSVGINLTVPSKAYKQWMKDIADKEYMKLSQLLRKLFEAEYGKFKENSEGYINGKDT